MSRDMGDSTDMNDIPSNVDVVAVYVNGIYGVVTRAQLDARFPNSRYGQVFIDVNGTRPDADVRDWENGDKAGSLQRWVVDHNHHTGKKNAVVYCNRSTVSEVRKLTGNQILGTDYWLWISTLDGTKVDGAGIIACQDKGANLTGGNWDHSILYDESFFRPVSPGKNRPSCVVFQKAIRTKPDNEWGADTDKNSTALVDAFHHRFPYGIEFAQTVVGTKTDGLWGPNSRRSCSSTIKNSQDALRSMGFHPGVTDGIWGPNTERAYEAARHACHI